MILSFGRSANNGRVLTTLGIIILSPDALLIRLVDADVWTTALWRGALTFLTILIILALRDGRTCAATVRFSLQWPGILVAPLWGFGTVCFVVAINETAVANVLIIIAAGPIFGAYLSRVFLKETIRIETWLASAGILVGLTLVFGDSWEAGKVFGDVCALGTALSTTTTFVVLRRADNADPMVLAGAGSLAAVIIVAPLATPTMISPSDSLFLAILGVIVLPLAYSLIFMGPRHIPAPEVSLIILLEAVLGPLWVWLALGEMPTGQVVAAGGLIITALAAHSAAVLRRTRYG